ncbi:MAG: thermonuclease family protein [Azospirillaceae bacterium]
MLRGALSGLLGGALAAVVGPLSARGAVPGPLLPRALAPERVATVVRIVDGDTLFLDDDTEVRLVGLQAPKRALGREGFVDWPLADEAMAGLGSLALGRRVALAVGGRPVDRHGRALAHLRRDDGVWIQGAMLERGLARVYSFADNRTAVADMLALERAARAALAGIWALDWYAVRPADPARLAADIDTFQLVEGRVRDAAIVRSGRIFLNFGDDWRRDVTATIAPDDRGAFREAGFDPLSLSGRTVRVRGWLYERNGPMIDVDHPEQIEVTG